MIALLIFILVQQARITTILIQHYEAFDADPIVYAANKYGINDCLCLISDDKSIWFNKTNSITIIKQHATGITLWDNKNL